MKANERLGLAPDLGSHIRAMLAFSIFHMHISPSGEAEKQPEQRDTECCSYLS